MTKSISIKGSAGSFGRVEIEPQRAHNETEEELFHLLVTYLSGKNAEKLLTGTHSTGCSGDYAAAKRIAGDMVSKYFMTNYGTSADEILNAADWRSEEIIQKERAFLEEWLRILLTDKELDTVKFADAYRSHRTEE